MEPKTTCKKTVVTFLTIKSKTMKQTLKTSFAAMVLLLAISCKKENSAIQPLTANDKSSTQALSNDVDGVAAIPSIIIGTQRWMTTNLNVSRYRNGDKIPQVKNAAAWAGLTTGAWCYYNNDPATGAIYGKLYNWYAVNDPRGLAPAGFHVPSNEEWTTLITFLGGQGVAGGAMKETGTVHWTTPNTDATNSSVFTGLPGGFRFNDGAFILIRDYGYWWSSTESESNLAWYRSLVHDGGLIGGFYHFKVDGLSVRCLRN